MQSIYAKNQCCVCVVLIQCEELYVCNVYTMSRSCLTNLKWALFVVIVQCLGCTVVHLITDHSHVGSTCSVYSVCGVCTLFSFIVHLRYITSCVFQLVADIEVAIVYTMTSGSRHGHLYTDRSYTLTPIYGADSLHQLWWMYSLQQ